MGAVGCEGDSLRLEGARKERGFFCFGAACHCGMGDTRTVAVLGAVRAVIDAVLAVLAG